MQLPIIEKKSGPVATSPVSKDLKKHDNRQALGASLFANPETHGAVLLQVALRFLDHDELRDFHPTTVRYELQDELRIKSIPDNNIAKLSAATVILTTDLFYRSLPHFIDICNALSDSMPIAGWFDPADPYEMAWAMVSSFIIDPEQSRDIEFSDEIRLYMGAALQEWGFTRTPKFLSVAMLPAVGTLSDISQDADILGAALESGDQLAADLAVSVQENLVEVAEQIKPFLFSEDD